MPEQTQTTPALRRQGSIFFVKVATGLGSELDWNHYRLLPKRRAEPNANRAFSKKLPGSVEPTHPPVQPRQTEQCAGVGRRHTNFGADFDHRCHQRIKLDAATGLHVLQH